MYKISISLLKKEKSKAVNLCLCIGMTIFSCLTFMQFILNTSLYENNFFFSSLICVFMILICVMLMINACNYYTTVKSREMGLLLLSGLSYFQVMVYNFIQLFIIVLVSACCGFALFFICNPILQYVLSIRLSTNINIFYMNLEVIKQCFALIATVFIIMLMINIGYIYKSSIPELLESNNIVHLKKDKRLFRFSPKFYMALYVIGLILMFFGDNQATGYIVFSYFGAVGAYGIFRYYIPDKYNKMQYDKIKGNKFIIFADIAQFTQKTKSLIAYLMVTLIVLNAFLLSTIDDLLLNFEIAFAFLISNIILSIALIDKFKIDSIERKKHFSTLYKMGFTKEELIDIYCKEIKKYFAIIWILSSVYILNTFFVYFINQNVNLLWTIFILLSYIMPYLFAELIILKERKREIRNDKEYN